MLKLRLILTLLVVSRILLTPGVDAGEPLFYEPFQSISAILANGGSHDGNGWPALRAGLEGNAADFSNSKKIWPPQQNLWVDSGWGRSPST